MNWESKWINKGDGNGIHVSISMKGWWPQVGVSTRQAVKADESTRGVCKSESLQGGSQRPYVEMAPTFFFFFLIFLYSIALYPQCFNLHIKTHTIRAAKLNVFGFFFHLIKNAQNRKRDVRKEEPPQPVFSLWDEGGLWF